ncbi:cupin domain-containing protein [Opitutaceae bacterium]|nr:cupin domain-containing protein [Opitutaceae bacterium]
MNEVQNLSSSTHSAQDVVAALNLEPLDREGGFFRRAAEAGLWVRPPDTSEDSRAYSVIYALFTPEGFSAMHRLATDEVWCWHAGDSLESLRLDGEGSGEWVRLGLNIASGERLQDIISAGIWQGTRLIEGGRWALVSCVVAPEFRWRNFALGERDELVAAYPKWAKGIEGLTRVNPPAGKR